VSVLDTLLISAITALAGVVGVLWRALSAAQKSANGDRREASRVIFALLGARAAQRCEVPPVTSSTPDAPQFHEATALAVEALNGDLERMVREYLTEPSKPPRSLDG
jgi:hypothetical protein